MELKIYSPQDTGFIQKIDWNYDELKKEIAAAIESYANSVYTDDMIKKAKEDRARLNKVSDALKKERTRIRKKLLEPDEQFGKEVQELTGMIQKAAANIDDQIKGYEERLREEKTAKVREFYEDNIHDIGKYLPFERVMQPRYALASTTMKSIKEEILALIQKVDEGLAVLNEVDSPYAGDMKKIFLETYDIGAAMAKRNQLEAEEQNRRLYREEMARRKVEQEAQRKAAAEIFRKNQGSKARWCYGISKAALLKYCVIETPFRKMRYPMELLYQKREKTTTFSFCIFVQTKCCGFDSDEIIRRISYRGSTLLRAPSPV